MVCTTPATDIDGRGPDRVTAADLDASGARRESTMSYFRNSFTSFQEFQRETGGDWTHQLGKEEYELLHEIEDDDCFADRPRRSERDEWD